MRVVHPTKRERIFRSEMATWRRIAKLRENRLCRNCYRCTTTTRLPRIRYRLAAGLRKRTAIIRFHRSRRILFPLAGLPSNDFRRETSPLKRCPQKHVIVGSVAANVANLDNNAVHRSCYCCEASLRIRWGRVSYLRSPLFLPLTSAPCYHFGFCMVKSSTARFVLVAVMLCSLAHERCRATPDRTSFSK